MYRACRAIGDARFLEPTNTKPKMMPSSNRGRNLCTLKCIRAKNVELSRTAAGNGIKVAKDGSTKPLNINCSPSKVRLVMRQIRSGNVP